MTNVQTIRPTNVLRGMLGAAIRDGLPEEHLDALRREISAAVIRREIDVRAARGGISAEHLPELIETLAKAVVR